MSAMKSFGFLFNTEECIRHGLLVSCIAQASIVVVSSWEKKSAFHFRF